MLKSMSSQTNYKMPADQRRRIRWKANLQCRVEVDGRTFYGDSIDISLGGVFIRSDAAISLHEKLLIEIHLPDCGAMQLEGSIRYVGRFLSQSGSYRGFGVKFERIRKTDIPKLLDLAKMASDPAEAKRVLEIHTAGLTFY